MSQFAHDTDVPVARSRAEIEQLLRRWGCERLQWTDNFQEWAATFRFHWTWEGTTYAARLEIRMPPDAVLRAEAKRTITAVQLKARREQRWRSLHRVLFLAIKAQLVAVDAGLVSAVETFLPYLEGPDGRTVAEVALPELRSGRLLLGSRS